MVGGGEREKREIYLQVLQIPFFVKFFTATTKRQKEKRMGITGERTVVVPSKVGLGDLDCRIGHREIALGFPKGEGEGRGDQSNSGVGRMKVDCSIME